MFPETTEEGFVGERQEGEEEDQDERGEPEGYIGVESGPEEETRKEEGKEFPGPESAEEEEEGKGKQERDHDRPEADAGEVDRPVGGRREEGGDEGGVAALEELPGEEADAEDCERTEDDRGKLERWHGRTECPYGERLDVYEEPLAAVVVRIEEAVIPGLVRRKRVDAVHRLVRVETERDAVDVVDAEPETEKRDGDECGPEERARPENEFHIFRTVIV